MLRPDNSYFINIYLKIKILRCHGNRIVSCNCYWQTITLLPLAESELGETDLLQMDVDTGNALPQYQSARHTLFAVQEEIAKQLNDMQKQRVISPSSSPWASPVVLVHKMDDTL